MRLEAITTCINYGDFLAHSLPENLQHVDHMVVVTSFEDKATKNLCNHLGVTCIQTDVATEHGDAFNKGRMINVGLAHCRHDDFLLHLDADTVLPHRFRWTLNAAKPEADVIYGADRLYVPNYEKWKTMEKLQPQWVDGCHVMPRRDLEMCSRILHGDYGYMPIGYFQLWSAQNEKHYPGSAGSAEHTDVLFALQWPRLKRVLLPQMFVYHLDSGGKQMGVNWEGRKSPAFCPCHSYMLPANLRYVQPQEQKQNDKKPDSGCRHHHHHCPYHSHHPHKHHEKKHHHHGHCAAD